MPVEPTTFAQMLELPPNDMMDLVDTVGLGALLNTHLFSSQQKRMDIAFAMMQHAFTILEHCGSQIETTMNHPTFPSPIYYRTDVNGLDGLLEK